MTLLTSQLIVLCAILHVGEEFFWNWVSWANQFVKGVTLSQFIFWNTLFLLLCILGVFSSSPTFKLSLASLMLFNVLVHLVPTMVRRQYSPGLVSALLLYIPLGIYSYFSAINNSLASSNQIIVSVPLGAIWMLIPFLYQTIRGIRFRS
jgi:hypothetical protein